MTGGSTIAIAAPHAAAVASAAEAVRAGGNAIDAALAAATALTVVYPHQCALGGDLIAIVHDERTGEPPVAIVSAGTIPEGLDLQGLAGSPMPRRGPATVTVPGIVAGWIALAEHGAALPLASALTAAAGLAASGPPVSAGLARAIETEATTIRADAGMSAVFAPDGQMLTEGDPLRQDALASTLRTLAADPRSIYDGEIAEQLAAGLQVLGCAHTTADLAAHTAEVVPAIGHDVDGARWWVAPPPSQGAVLLGVLPAAMTTLTSGDPAALVEACLTGIDVRDRALGDPRTAPVDIDALVSLHAAAGSSSPASPAKGDTVAITAVDDAGLSVTVIQSVFHTFGAGMLEPSTGIVVHNRGAAFTTDPGSPARIRHGSRPPHTLCPAIVETAELVVAVGCQGGRAQAWILAQAAPPLLDPTAVPTDVLAQPRWIVGIGDLGHDVPTLVAEPGVETACRAAERLGVPVDRRTAPQDEAGHVQTARRHRDGSRVDAGTDPRADGATAVVPVPIPPPPNRSAP